MPALSNKNIDGFVWVEPQIFYAKRALDDNFVEFKIPEYKEFINIAVRKDFVERNPELVKKFIKGLIKSDEFIKQNRNETINIVSKKLAINENDLDKVWDASFIFEINLDGSLLVQLEKEAKWAIESGKVSKDTKIPYFCDNIYADALNELKSEAVTIECP